MRRTGLMATLALAAAVTMAAPAAAKTADMTVDIQKTAKLRPDGVAEIRTAVKCARIPGPYRVILAELSGGQEDRPATGGVTRPGHPITCDGRTRIYTSDSFSTFKVFDPNTPELRPGPAVVSAFILVESLDGTVSRSGSDEETVRLK